jgi:ribosome-binding protein aMBF1 (putative translation factor)
MALMAYDITRIHGERLARGWSRGKLAQQSGIHENTIYRIEIGERAPRPETAKAIADALGLSLRELVIVPASRKDAA